MPKRRNAKLFQVLCRKARQSLSRPLVASEPARPERVRSRFMTCPDAANTASYFPRPRLRSQTTMSMTAPTIGERSSWFG